MNNDICAYELICCVTLEDFNKTMDRVIKNGWVPFGNLQIVVNSCGATYNQPVVQYNARNPNVFQVEIKDAPQFDVRLDTGACDRYGC